MLDDLARTAGAPNRRLDASTFARDHSRSPGFAAWVLAAATIVIATVALRSYAAKWHWPQVAAGLCRESPITLAVAFALTLSSFAALGAYDILGCSVVVPGRIRESTDIADADRGLR
jgi:uncharacterized membrane protein YbhN (UPF0104 family)